MTDDDFATCSIALARGRDVLGDELWRSTLDGLMDCRGIISAIRAEQAARRASPEGRP
jgi:hypothetical protein